MRRRHRALLALRALPAAALIAVGLGCREAAEAPPPTPPPFPWPDVRPALAPRWVLEPWVWEDDRNTQAATLELVDGYLRRDLPVGAVIVDSPWQAPGEAGYQSFRFDRGRYPDPEAMIAALHARGVRVVVWATGNLVPEAPDYAAACARGFFVRAVGAADPCPTTSFWKGSGRASHVDFFAPDALAWWRSMLDRVLDLGVDGMKVDGTDLQLAELGDPVATGAGPRSTTAYSEAMYRTFLSHLRTRRPDAAILARPYAEENGVARWYAPPDAATAGWVGDQEQSWDGLREALLEIFVSARAGYAVVGSDVGGFRPSEEGALDARLFVRWAQLGAWLPLFEIGGRGEHRPWAFGEEALAIFRRSAHAHRTLVPYLHHLVIRAHRTGAPVVQPIGDGPAAWDGDWRYRLGDDVLVAALDRDVDERDVALPADTWHDWWEPARRYEGPATIRVATPLDRYPVFVRAGSVLPVAADGAGDAPTLLVFPGTTAAHRLHLGPATELEVALAPRPGGVRISVGAVEGGTRLRVHRGDGTFLERDVPAGGGSVDLELASGIVGGEPPADGEDE